MNNEIKKKIVNDINYTITDFIMATNVVRWNLGCLNIMNDSIYQIIKLLHEDKLHNDIAKIYFNTAQRDYNSKMKQLEWHALELPKNSALKELNLSIDPKKKIII